MNVSTDPRTIKQLLMSQWLSPADLLNASPARTAQDSGIFNLMLNQLLSPGGDDQTSSLPLPFSGTAAGIAALTGGAGIDSGTLAPDTSGTSSAYDDLIVASASRYGLDPALIKGVIQTESGFNAAALSSAGAKGLMQLMDATAKGLGVGNVWDPAQNIDGGARYLSYLLRKYDGHVYSALAAYNAGPGRVDRLGLTNDELVRARYAELPEETQRYIPKVLQAAQQWSLKV